MNYSMNNTERTASFSDEESETYLEDIPLTDKTYNALNKMGVETLNEIVHLYHSGNLTRIKGIGRKEEKEIEAILRTFSRTNLLEKESIFEETLSEYDRRKDLFLDWLEENQISDELPNFVYVIENLEEYISTCPVLNVPIFNEYSPYTFESLLGILQNDSNAEAFFDKLLGETILFISYYIDYLYEEDAGIHYKRRKIQVDKRLI